MPLEVHGPGWDRDSRHESMNQPQIEITTCPQNRGFVVLLVFVKSRTLVTPSRRSKPTNDYLFDWFRSKACSERARDLPMAALLLNRFQTWGVLFGVDTFSFSLLVTTRNGKPWLSFLVGPPKKRHTPDQKACKAPLKVLGFCDAVVKSGQNERKLRCAGEPEPHPCDPSRRVAVRDMCFCSSAPPPH